jgi:hypothetical protein
MPPKPRPIPRPADPRLAIPPRRAKKEPLIPPREPMGPFATAAGQMLLMEARRQQALEDDDG